MKSHSENDALAIRRAAREMLIDASGDRTSTKKGLSPSELRAASSALALAQRMEHKAKRQEESDLWDAARDWFLGDPSRTIQQTADRFGLKFAAMRQRAYGDDWIEARGQINAKQEAADAANQRQKAPANPRGKAEKKSFVRQL